MPSKNKPGEGVVEAYIHANKKIGVMLELFCETDFAAKTPEFKELAHDLAMQITAMGAKNLLKQKFIKNPEITIKELIQEKREKLGEEISIGKIIKYAI